MKAKAHPGAGSVEAGKAWVLVAELSCQAIPGLSEPDPTGKPPWEVVLHLRPGERGRVGLPPVGKWSQQREQTEQRPGGQSRTAARRTAAVRGGVWGAWSWRALGAGGGGRGCLMVPPASSMKPQLGSRTAPLRLPVASAGVWADFPPTRLSEGLCAQGWEQSVPSLLRGTVLCLNPTTGPDWGTPGLRPEWSPGLWGPAQAPRDLHQVRSP